MKTNIKNIYQLRGYLQVQRIIYLLFLMRIVESYKLRENERNRTLMKKDVDRTQIYADERGNGRTNVINYFYENKNNLKNQRQSAQICVPFYTDFGYDGTATFTSIQGGGTATPTENLGNGQYQTWYTTGPVPDVNRIEVGGEATVTVPEVLLDPSTGRAITEDYVTPTLPSRAVLLQSGQGVLFNRDTKDPIMILREGMLVYTVFGVDIDLTIEPGVIVLDDEGYSTVDITFKYTILPPEYNAIIADIDFYRIDENNNEEWAGYLVDDATQGEGTGVFIAGSYFDITKRYEAEVVLNRGGDIEIRGDRVELVIAQIKVLNDVDTTEVDEIKFGDGSNTKKVYHVELASKALTESCESLSGAIRVVDRNLAALEPDTNVYYSAEYPLAFAPVGGRCLVKVVDTTVGVSKDKFIITNLSKVSLAERQNDLNDIAPLYGGIGNQIEIEINSAKKHVPIEPVGVIVMAIDGLRQDVLYDQNEQQVLLGQQSPYYVQPSELKGLCDVMGGKYDGNTCDAAGWENRHIKLKNVTAIFPSITLASWASVFTGKMPNETGIPGNEFFARDRSLSVPARYNKPSGIISFGGGAFKGFDAFPKWALKDYDFLVPYQPDWKNPITPEDTPQNYIEILTTKTVYEDIKEIPGVKSYFSERDGDPVVVANLHYARGAYWLTWDIDLKFGGSSIVDVPKTLDHQSWDKLDDYLGGKYLAGFPGFKKRNDIPFSALTVWYLPGLDKKAHEEGMGVYKDYFMDTTDSYIEKVVNRLKKLDEFDNKIFIIVSDHGVTAMPEFGLTTVPIGNRQIMVVPDNSCELRLDGFNDDYIQYSEKTNNNLHIWELGEMLKAVGSIQNAVVRNKYRLLVPEEIKEIFEKEDVPVAYRATSSIYNAEIVAAFNGPMAHIYSMIGTDNKTLGEMAEVFKLMLSYYPSDAHWLGFNDLDDYIEFQEETVGRLWKSIDKILIRMEDGNYYVFNGLDSNGNPITEGLNTLTGSEYIEAELRITGMNNKDRSGDIVLVMKDKMTDSALNRFTTGTACKSWHGSLNPSDSYVPMIVSYPGGNKKEIEDILQKDTLCNTDYSNCKGNWKLTDIVREIIREQYE